MWNSINVVPVIQGKDPDLVNNFIWGVQNLDDARKVERGEASSAGYTRLTAALFDRMTIAGEDITDPAEIIRMLREGKVGTLVVRKIDWEKLADQHRAWEAVA